MTNVLEVSSEIVEGPSVDLEHLLRPLGIKLGVKPLKGLHLQATHPDLEPIGRRRDTELADLVPELVDETPRGVVGNRRRHGRFRWSRDRFRFVEIVLDQPDSSIDRSACPMHQRLHCIHDINPGTDKAHFRKVQSVGAQKGVMFSTSHFQSGALAYAKTHGIALVFVTEGRLTIERRSADDLPPLSKEVTEEWGVEPIAGTYYGMGDSEGSTVCAYIGPDRPDLVTTYLLPAQTSE